MGSHSLLQGIFLTQRSNPGLLHCRQILSLSEQPGKPLLKYIINSTYQLIVLISSLIFVSYVHFFLLYELCSGVSIRRGFPGGPVVKNPSTIEGGATALGSISGWRRSPGVWNSYPLQYSCLENPQAEEPGGPQSMVLQRVGHDWAHAHTRTCARAHTHTHPLVIRVHVLAILLYSEGLIWAHSWIRLIYKTCHYSYFPSAFEDTILLFSGICCADKELINNRIYLSQFWRLEV